MLPQPKGAEWLESGFMGMFGRTEAEVIRELRERYGIHLFRLSTRIPTLNSNIYFAENPIPTLIDVPEESSATLEQLDSCLRNVGYSINSIKAIVITHPHFDHFGSARTIVEKSGAEVLATRGTGVWIENCEGECREEAQFIEVSLEWAGAPEKSINDCIAHFWSLKESARAVGVSRYIEKGEYISFSSFRVRVEEVPGHTPWCIMLYDQDNKIAFTGDFLLGEISPNPLIQRPWRVAAGYRSLKAYLSSLDRVRGLNLRLALPGHGGLIMNPSLRISNLLELIKERRDLILSTLRATHGRTVFDIVKEVFPEICSEDLFLAVSEVCGHLQALREDGLVMETKGTAPLFMLL